jgi:hypothetical protein
MLQWYNSLPVKQTKLITEYQLPITQDNYYQLFEEIISGKKVDTNLAHPNESNAIHSRIKGEPIYGSQGTIQGVLLSFKTSLTTLLSIKKSVRLSIVLNLSFQKLMKVSYYSTRISGFCITTKPSPNNTYMKIITYSNKG